VIDAVIQAAAFLALALVVELIAPLGRVSWKSRLIGLQLTLAKALGAALLIPVLYRGWSALGVQPIDLGIGFGDSIIGAIIGVSFAVLTSDFLGYWHHRFMHRFFWPVHATHHAIRELSALNAYAHFAEKITQFLIMVIPLSVIQWDSPVVPPAIILAVTWSEYWIHSPTTAQLNGLRGIFVTPRFHRIHHSLEPQHFDKNFGILFSFWDRLFGSAFNPASDEWPATGLADRQEARSIADYLIYPLRFR
jgi:sterol desaturase/sphingolipid hydroxylase (fatty acid hydroxylase superfamily)